MFRFNFKALSRAGSVLVMTAFASVFLLGMTAMVTDVGYMYYNQARLQTAVNAGWKAGYDLMMQLKAGDGNLSDTEQAQVISHVKEIMKVNGYTDAELAGIQVTFGAQNHFEVSSRQNVGLFFANIMNFSSATVTAARENHAMDLGQGIVPLAIPYGVTKDLSRNYFQCALYNKNPDGTYNTEAPGFASGSEYILKLGSGGKKDPNAEDPPIIEDGKIFIPMDSAQTADGLLRAYGVVYWCLKIDEADVGYVPAEWLLGYRGGSFFLPNHVDIAGLCKTYNVYYEELTEVTHPGKIAEIYEAVNPNILELYVRPKVAVYSSQSDPDPVELVLREARIPYGTYSLPGNWDRKSRYTEGNNTVFYDREILSGQLDQYEWLHLHHEDFTGFAGGCSYWLNSCRDSLNDLHLGSLSKESYRNTCRDRMCAYCRNFYNAKDNVWTAGYEPRPSNDVTNCLNARRRCTEKATYTGVKWTSIDAIKICGEGDPGYPQCSQDADLRAIADSFGFTSDAGSEPKTQYSVYQDGSHPLPDDYSNWFDKANKVQKMKWEVSHRIKTHVYQGGFLFAQCFAPETLDLSLWQRAIYNGTTPAEAYRDCLAFNDFHYKVFPRRTYPTYYSTINTANYNESQFFSLANPIDPRCQNHGVGYACNTGRGHTAGFVNSQIKPETVLLGSMSNGTAKYVKGFSGNGEFTFLGGHYHHNIEAKRLVLNNLLLGSLVEKDTGISGDGTTTVVGKQKSKYGPIDPDNYVGGGANDYRDRFMYGFNQPLQLNDRVITESGNMRGPTDQAVDFRVNGDANYAPNRFIIVPITDVPPEVGTNNTANSDSSTVYDLQGQDNPGGIYDPTQYGFGSSVRIIGFAMFEVLDPTEYTRDGENYEPGDAGDLGPYQPGQVRGKFVRYVVKPGEVPLY